MNEENTGEEEREASLNRVMGLFKDHVDSLRDELKDFNQRHEQIREELRHGGVRHTRGRIV